MTRKLFTLAVLLVGRAASQQTPNCPSLEQPALYLVNGDGHVCIIDHPRQVDTWLLSANARDWIVLTATRTDPSSSFFPNIVLIGPDGQIVAGALGHHNVALVNVSAPSSGTYSVQISSNAGQGGAPLDGTGGILLWYWRRHPNHLIRLQAMTAVQ